MVAEFEAASEAGATLEALLPVVYADTAPLVWPLARLSLEAHPIKLEREGRVVRRKDRWRRAAGRLIVRSGGAGSLPAASA